MFTIEPSAKIPMTNWNALRSGAVGGLEKTYRTFLPTPNSWSELYRGVAFVVFGCALASPGVCQVYVGNPGSGGSIVLSNFPSQEAPELLLSSADTGISPVPAKLKVVTNFPPKFKLPERVDHLRGVIESVALSVNIAPRLIHAVISAESNFNAKAVSPKGAIGLMQLMPATARRFGVEDPFVIEDNVFAGASYLKWLMGYFEGDIELVLAAYNAGENAVVRAGRKVPNYPETQAYVRRIMADLRSTQSLPL